MTTIFVKDRIPNDKYTCQQLFEIKKNLLQKLHFLVKEAGENSDFSEKYAAIKIYFGEYGNLAFWGPNL